MSASYTVTAAAKADLANIYRYTAERWGFRQADLYQASLTEHFAHIAKRPLMGVSRDYLAKGLRSHQTESHMIYYRTGREEVEFVRVLHTKQDARRAFRR